MSKNTVVTEMGYSKDQASDYQRMAQNQAVTSSGIENANTVKLGRCIKELERIYGIKNGGDRKSEETKLPLKSQGKTQRLIGKGVEILPHLKTKHCGRFTTK